ncbi:MAG: DUF454 family protein [Lachnospiraceae bacterium]|nr:DUF454 family protein [Lachnospiraceae bacterium]
MSMRKMICLVGGIILLVLGLIGLALPVIPQIPFLAGGLFLLMKGSGRFRAKILSSELYRKHIRWRIEANRYTKRLLQVIEG